MQTKTADANVAIYDELLAREYGALVLRTVVGKNMMRGVLIASISIWSILGIWWGVEYIKKLRENDTPLPPRYIDLTKLAAPPSLTQEEIVQIKIKSLDAPPPAAIKVQAVEDSKVADTVKILTVQDIAKNIDAGRTSVSSGDVSSGNVVVAPPADDDYIPKPDEVTFVEKDAEPISTPSPKYPAQAMTARVPGNVVVQFLVNKKGEVAQVKILKAEPSGFGFEEATTTTVKGWKFKPAINNGQPVSIWYTQPIKFKP